MSDTLNLRGHNMQFITFFSCTQVKNGLQKASNETVVQELTVVGESGWSVLSNVTYSKTGWSYFEGIRDKEFLAVCSFFPVSNLHFLLHVLQSFVRYHTSEAS